MLRTYRPDKARATGGVEGDRVGVPASVPLATGGTGTTQVMDALWTASDQAGIPSARSQDKRASDHWSFEKADIPSARVGSVPYPGYHSAGDVPSVVDPEQLGRVGTIVWTWLQTQ